ncbi:MAG TPA: hypothetical protein VJ767_11200 [Nitrososphaeraceae archaeon]|nr:hypothetical protein [Nitrososphaeraceae archaeon]
MEPGKNSVIVPFKDIITQSVPKDNASDITFTARLFRLIGLIPLFKQGKRPYLQIRKKGDTKVQKYPFALFEDLSESLFLMEYSNGLRPYVLEWYHDIFIALYNSKIEPDSKITSKGEQLTEHRRAVTTEELVTKTFQKYNKTYTKKQILDTYVYPLINSGYIDKIESTIDKRQNIYYPLINGEKNKNLFEIEQSNKYLQKRKLFIEHLAPLPSKEYIISKIKEVLKYSESIDGFIKIFDHNANEITTVEELVYKYNNSEDYFKIRNISRKDNNSSEDSGDIICSKPEDTHSSCSLKAEEPKYNCENTDVSKIKGVSEYIENN